MMACAWLSFALQHYIHHKGHAGVGDVLASLPLQLPASCPSASSQSGMAHDRRLGRSPLPVMGTLFLLALARAAWWTRDPDRPRFIYEIRPTYRAGGAKSKVCSAGTTDRPGFQNFGFPTREFRPTDPFMGAGTKSVFPTDRPTRRPSARLGNPDRPTEFFVP